MKKLLIGLILLILIVVGFMMFSDKDKDIVDSTGSDNSNADNTQITTPSSDLENNPLTTSSDVFSGLDSAVDNLG